MQKLPRKLQDPHMPASEPQPEPYRTPQGHSCLKYQHFCEPPKSELNPSYSIPLTAPFSQNELQIFCTLSEGEKIKKKGLYSSHALAFHELCYKLSIEQ